MIGKTISHYKILDKLGEGGMGVVYKAEDTRLHRTVAVKFLRSDSVEDEELTTRFRHEAEAAASLDHSNICTVYEIDEADGQIFLVIAFVDGPSLKEAIAERPLKLDVALDLAIQIAEGLSAAHEAEIVHRDIKPGNIMLNRRRQAKILDFGLAHLGAATQITKTGTIIGTPAYMSPEQVRGEKADRRTDVWSLGVVLYEMLTGRVPFQGESGQAVALSIQNETPEPPTAMRSGIPKELDGIVSKALAKDPANRYQHVEDLLVDLRRLKQDSDSGSGKQLPAAPGNRRTGLYVAAALLTAALVTWLAVRQRPGEEVDTLPTVAPLTTYPGQELSPTFSPDGNDVAFSWNGPEGDSFDIYRLMVVDAGEARTQLTNDPANDLSPAWSPDGKWIAFLRDLGEGRAAVIRIPHTGGSEEQLAEVACRSQFRRMLDWSPDGRWMAVMDEEAPGKGCAVFLLSVETRERRRVVDPPAYPPPYHSPRFSPDGRRLAYLRAHYLDRGLPGELLVQRLSAELKPLDKPAHLGEELEITGSPSWTQNGKEIITAAVRQGRRELWRVPTSGNGPPRQVPSGDGVRSPVLSAKGDRLVYVREDNTTNIWRLTIPQPGEELAPPERFISSTWSDAFPRYSPDGMRIVLQSSRSGMGAIWTCDSEAQDWRQLTFPDDGTAGSPSWSPDGKQIAFDAYIDDQYEIYTMPSSGGISTQFTDHPAGNYGPTWSHDGKWIYFYSNRGGSGNVWKKPVGGGEAVRVTKQGGMRPAESRDGKWVYYVKSTEGIGGLWRAPSDGGEEVRILDSVTGPGFTVIEDGIYFVAWPDIDGSSSIQFYSFDEARSHVISPIEGVAFTRWGDCEVSPDQKWVLFRQVERRDADLMLVENFR